ncbi:MAG: DUF262 domain-containing HNH endonuclease family protein [Coriobacteriia bacterium]|jgi:hypothetical protein|nr:DUF262 domain-containing HNH endonuclease family protein [Coriobacteriia bacterium]MDR2714442.1 DUF262 domain-containing HNH endonuclease family protein [Coriobacteriales bacterium]
MSKLNVDQKNIKDLLTDKSANFLIPDYQRPYAWAEDECQTLWDDIFSFAFPDGNKDAFNTSDEYFLGAIVTYKNESKQAEVIDGQQRLTTILLLLRAFYDRFECMGDKPSQDTRTNISQCIWQTDEFGNADMKHLKIDSEVATDDEKDEFLSILKTGKPDKKANSRYAKNYRFFMENIDSFIDSFASYLPFLPSRILNNCILLPIEADSQDTALRIFSTLNDRGLPLADADIFKAQFYKHFEKQGTKNDFIENWKDLSFTAEKIFKPIYGTPMDELFTKYMYFIRASEGIKSTTTEALRKFYEHDKYRRLLSDDTIKDLLSLLDFWKSVYYQDEDRFSEEVLKKLFVLKYAPNGMWEYITSVYFLSYRDAEGNLEDIAFANFLSKITAFIFAYALTNPGVNALRTPVYAEMIKICNKQQSDFSDYRFSREHIQKVLDNYKFTNNRAVTRSLITWYAFTFEEQERPKDATSFDIEHIYARERHNKENKLQNPDNLEELGNKILLEKSINIRASDYRFEDKKRYYCGHDDARGRKHEKSRIAEYKYLTQKDDFTESDIIERDKRIHEKFISYLAAEDLLKD